MAMPRKVPVSFDIVFPHGAYMVGEISPVRDYDRSTKENPVQATDPDTGVPIWAVDVVDADPEANKSYAHDDGQGHLEGPAGLRRPWRTVSRSDRWSSTR